MRTRKMSKMMAAILSAAMVMSMSMTAFATEGAGTDTTPTTGSKAEVEAPIYSYDLTDVVVPTDFKVAFNPDGLLQQVQILHQQIRLFPKIMALLIRVPRIRLCLLH